jgi:hypothetical protein
MNQPKKNKIIASISVSLFFGFTACVFMPLALYYENALEFSFRMVEALPLLIGGALVLSIISFIVVSVFRESLHIRLVSVVFAVGVLLWVQGNILVWNYGQLNGAEIRWSDHTIHGIIDSLVWITGLIAAVLAARKIYPVVKTGSAVFIAIQLVSVCFAGYKAPEIANFQRYTPDESRKFVFSAKRNVIFLILDTFGSKTFNERLNVDTVSQNSFDGFTYFSNAVGGAPTTYLAVPYILTGVPYYNSKPIQQYVKEAYLSPSAIPTFLKANGFETQYFGELDRAIYYDDKVISNISRKKKVDNSDIAYLIDLGLFRILPNFLKPLVLNNQHWLVRNLFISTLIVTVAQNSQTNPTKTGSLPFSPEAILYSRDVKFLSDLISNVRIDSSTEIMKFYHLQGVHPPYILNENLEYDDTMTRGFSRQAAASVKIAARFVEELKRIGVYDNSLIFILADHGDWQVMIDAANPFLLVKRIGEKGRLKISKAPVTFGEISSTVAREIGIPQSFEGVSLFGIPDSAQRERKFRYYKWMSDDYGFNNDYVKNLVEYSIYGDVQDANSWKETFVEYTPTGVKHIHRERYRYGARVNFSKNESKNDFNTLGWSEPESLFTWTNGNRTDLVFPIDSARSDLILTSSLFPFLGDGSIRAQVADIFCNNVLVGHWDVFCDGIHRCKIPQAYTYNGTLQISFHIPNAARPTTFGHPSDSRRLGLGFRWLQLDELIPYSYGSVLSFKNGSDGIRYLAVGWYDPEQNAVWSQGNSARITLQIIPTSKTLTVKVHLVPFLVPGKITHQRVHVAVNGKDLKTWDVLREGDYLIDIPSSLIKENELSLVFKLPDAASPSKHGSKDPRVLGIMLFNLQITEAEQN